MPYTSIVNSGLGIGLTLDDLREMQWGRLILMLQAQAQSYSDEPEEATFEQIRAAFGA